MLYDMAHIELDLVYSLERFGIGFSVNNVNDPGSTYLAWDVVNSILATMAALKLIDEGDYWRW